MSIQLGDEAPDFEAPTTAGPIRFHAWKANRWAVLFSHPRDFTPVCTTELGALARRKDEFDARDTVVLGLSVDSLDSHLRWLDDIATTQGVQVNFPVIADPEREISQLYGMIHPAADDSAAVRSVFIIGPDNKVKLTLTYPASTGRNFDELLRVLDSLQLTAHHKVATPADWIDGDPVIILPALSDAEARQSFPGGWTAPRPYLRIIDQPEPAPELGASQRSGRQTEVS